MVFMAETWPQTPANDKHRKREGLSTAHPACWELLGTSPKPTEEGWRIRDELSARRLRHASQVDCTNGKSTTQSPRQLLVYSGFFTFTSM
jgi:hypothetical protein